VVLQTPATVTPAYAGRYQVRHYWQRQFQQELQQHQQQTCIHQQQHKN
jgi:hypothetical protein